MTMDPTTRVSKSRFKARALEYLRAVEQQGVTLIVTDRGRPAVTIRPYVDDPEAQLQMFRGSVLRYDDPLEPVGDDDWEALT